MRSLIAIATAPLLALLLALPAHAEECADVTMPHRVNVAGTPLVLNGMGIRQATVFNVDVYVAGLYLESPSRDARQILESDQKMRIVLRLVRDVDREDMVEALTDGVRSNAGNSYASMRPRVQRLARWIPELEEGDTITFTYVPGQGVSVNVKGRAKGTIEGQDFARAFFAIWLGSHPPNAALKRGLLGGACD